jgi:DNA-binding transcriptional MerR regulator
MMDRENDDKRIYYTMGEVAEMLDVNHSLLRYWESEFDVLRPTRNKKGNRLFTPEDLDKVKLIYHLVKEQGLKIAVAKKRIKEEVRSHRDDIALVDRLMYIRAQLEQINQELKEGGLSNTDDADSAGMPEAPEVSAKPAKNMEKKEPEIDFEVIEEEFILENSADDAETAKSLFVEQTLF